ncbi:MAG: response regulator [Deltaproteobacteria bacterium]|nr:response regulator [Deltaproteobacteria bacterium]
MKILVVDDDPSTRILLDRLLTSWGYETMLSDRGERALELLNDTPDCQLTILDWMMPGLSGLEVCQALRADTRLRHLPVILLTSRNSPEDRDLARQAGVNRFLVKPVDRDELKSSLQELA